jgi:hypothetical protein
MRRVWGPASRRETAHRAGLDTAILAALAPWRKSRAAHGPGKILPDLVMAVVLGGDCLSDAALFGPLASVSPVSGPVDTVGGQVLVR